MTWQDTLREQLTRHEGYRQKPYRDTVGKLTIGVGHNLDDKGLRDDEIQLILSNDISDAIADCHKLFPNFDSLSGNRKAAVANMMFNMGLATFSQFHLTIAAINSGAYKQAAKFMLDSKWANQVGNRATELANLMEAG